MAKSKITESEVLAYLQQRKYFLQEELSQIEAALTFFGEDVKSNGKKDKKKGKKKKLEKAIRKRVAKAADEVDEVKTAAPKRGAKLPKSAATPETVATVAATLEDESEGRRARRGRATAAKPASDSRKITASLDSVSTAVAPVAKRKAAGKSNKSVSEPPIVVVPSLPKDAAKDTRPSRRTKKASAAEPAFDTTATIDEKIRFALAQKNGRTKAELIDYLNGLEPSYGLTKLKRVVAFRLNHLVKTGQISAQESDGGRSYAI